jgi:hypothetical protein
MLATWAGGTHVGEWQRMLASRVVQQSKLRWCEEFLYDLKRLPAGAEPRTGGHACIAALPGCTA